MNVPVRVTSHAVERYVDRIDSGATADEARRIIQERLQSSVRQREKTFSGEAIFLAKDMRLVVAEERGSRTVLTILPEYKGRDSEEVPEIAAALNDEFRLWADEQLNSGTKTKSKNEQWAHLHLTLSQMQAGIERRNKTIQTLTNELAGRVSKKRHDKQVKHAELMNTERLRRGRVLKSVAVELLADRVGNALLLIDEEFPGLIEKLRKEMS